MPSICIYSCKICKKNGKEFKSDRRGVRKHLREEHNIRGKLKTRDGCIAPSQLTLNTIVEEIE
jgi:hypothetical protein